MTDEEMADKYAEEYVMREDVVTENDRVPFDNGYGFQTVSFENEVKKGYKDGFLAGLKAGRPQWHDLRKDPNDLPKEVGNYIVCFLDTACERHTFELSFVDYFEDKHWIDEDNHNIEGYDEGVIAWCELPTFDKE